MTETLYPLDFIHNGNRVVIEVDETHVTVKDFGRIPLRNQAIGHIVRYQGPPEKLGLAERYSVGGVHFHRYPRTGQPHSTRPGWNGVPKASDKKALNRAQRHQIIVAARTLELCGYKYLAKRLDAIADANFR